MNYEVVYVTEEEDLNITLIVRDDGRLALHMQNEFGVTDRRISLPTVEHISPSVAQQVIAAQERLRAREVVSCPSGQERMSVRLPLSQMRRSERVRRDGHL